MKTKFSYKFTNIKTTLYYYFGIFNSNNKMLVISVKDVLLYL